MLIFELVVKALGYFLNIKGFANRAGNFSDYYAAVFIQFGQCEFYTVKQCYENLSSSRY